MMYSWLVLKIIHVVAGVLWVGSAVVIAAFLMPSARALGPQAAPFMSHLMQKQKLSQYMMMVSGLNALSGLIMYWRVSSGFSMMSLHWPGGIGLIVGMVSGLIILIWGHAVQAPTAKKLGQLTAQLSGAPSPEQQQAIQMLQDKLNFGAWFGVAGLMLSVIGMTMLHF